ncbi:hypothetical protein VPHK469_0100 [Vibrio phage K469]
MDWFFVYLAWGAKGLGCMMAGLVFVIVSVIVGTWLGERK